MAALGADGVPVAPGRLIVGADAPRGGGGGIVGDGGVGLSGVGIFPPVSSPMVSGAEADAPNAAALSTSSDSVALTAASVGGGAVAAVSRDAPFTAAQTAAAEAPLTSRGCW